MKHRHSVAIKMKNILTELTKEGTRNCEFLYLEVFRRKRMTFCRWNLAGSIGWLDIKVPDISEIKGFWIL